ncbi:peptidase C14 [Rhodopseudomonas boonkerdii]|uniref:caspase family protein n=1 Tax=Rhodopseudomonas boonkerdii TaxID=475937 RepID=UPI001E40F5B2|nr:caspase domain-containing protein [Rhodopseudomonas boonkerdii]UGV26407.1 peptidase C14 [Rhodopseudomonas boonkerdii]
MRALAFLALTFIAAATLSPTHAQPVEKRVALVIGNAAYPSGALPTTANDAGLIAQTLQAAGFDVTGARDLDQDTLRRTFREFLDKVNASGPDTVAFVYLGGHGVQLEGENYFVPVDAKLAHDTDLPLEALRLSDYIRPLSAVKVKAGIVVLDAARASPFAKSGEALASGLALVEPDKNMLIAFNAAPGTVAPAEQGPYGAYAQALAEMIRTGGLSLGDVFERTRLRVNEATKGGEIPWHASKVEAPIVFFDRAADAPAPPPSNDRVASIRTRPIRDLGAQDAYVVALERDTMQGYLDFLDAYPNDVMAKRVRAIVAARREALTWRRTRNVDTPPAYWSYLRRYPGGPHVADARRRLAVLAAAFDPPPTFTAISYDIAPPPVEEEVYFRRPVLVFDDPVYAFAPPPPPPVILLPPPPPDFVVLAPPPPVFAAFVLPVPDYVPLPVYYSPPPYVAPPPPNIIYNNIHNTVVINNNTKMVTITSPGGAPQTVTPAQALAPSPVAAGAGAPPANAAPNAPGAPSAPPTTTGPSPSVSHAVAGAAAGAALLAPTLPSSAARKANLTQPTQPLQPPTRPNANPAAATTQGGQLPAGQTANTPNAPKPLGTALPGAPGGQPLPANNKPPGTDHAQPPGHSAPQPPASNAAAPPQPGQKASSNAQGTHPTAGDRSTATQQTPTKPALTGNKPTAPEHPVVQQTPSHASSAPGAPQPPRNDTSRRPAASVNARPVSPPQQRPAASTASAHTNAPPVARPVQRQAVARPAPPPARPMPPPARPMASAPPARPVAAARPMMAAPPRPAPVTRAAPPPSKPCHPAPGQQCK